MSAVVVAAACRNNVNCVEKLLASTEIGMGRHTTKTYYTNIRVDGTAKNGEVVRSPLPSCPDVAIRAETTGERGVGMLTYAQESTERRQHGKIVILSILWFAGCCISTWDTWKGALQRSEWLASQVLGHGRHFETRTIE